MSRIRYATLLALISLPACADDDPARRALQQALGGEAIGQIAAFDYRLSVSDGDGRVLRDGDYRLQPASARLYVHDRLAPSGDERWSDPHGSWRRSAGQWDFLGPAGSQSLRAHVAYHFLALLADPAAGIAQPEPQRLRLTPSGREDFDVLLDARNGRIVGNRFDDGTHVRELDYAQVGALAWPMRFEVMDGDTVVQRGTFSDTRVHGDAAALPPMTIAPAAPTLAPPVPDAARLLGAGWLSSARNDYNLSTDSAGRLMVFARSDADFGNARILVSRRQGAQWGEPAPATFSDPRYSDSDPWLTPDGRTLYFVSNRPAQGDAARKDLDVWRVALDAEGGFGVPEPLPSLHSDGQELGPELHDGWLYFNSSRKGGPAPLSIWRARADGAGFDTPQPLGAPFNDGEAQGDFTLSPDGRIALFWSERDGAQGGDIYAARRESGGWSKAERLPSPINSPGFDFTPAFSADGRELRFASMRKPGWIDDATHLLNGQANLYTVEASMIDAASD